MDDADTRVQHLILSKLRLGDAGWKSAYPAPTEHLSRCPDVRVVESEARYELWFDTGVDAVRLTAVIQCPHEGPVEWEWADLGELPDLLDELDETARLMGDS
jgi:hypothetical protein